MIQEGKCKVAVVGAGYMGREHIRAFTDIPNVKVAGITDRTISRAEALAGEYQIPYVCGSIEELYEKTRADLVVVCVPELAANQVSRACFEFPWVALLEKPAGYNLDDAKDIQDVASQKERKVFVALNRRFYSSTRNALAGVEGVPGPRFIHVLDQEDQVRALEAGQPKKVVENWMYANSIHIVDYLRLFGRGRILSVEQVVPWNSQEPWVVIAKVNFESGDVGLYEGVWNAPGPWSVSINTRIKRWEMRPVEQLMCQSAGQRKAETVELHPWDTQFKPGLRLMAEQAVNAVYGQMTDLPNLSDSFDSMKLVSQIFGI
jgi:predicted dehydrogenase